MYLSANKRSWFSTGTFVRNPFSPTFWFPTCKIAGTQNCRACAGTQAPPQLCYFRWSHITGFGQWTVSERTCHFHAEKGWWMPLQLFQLFLYCSDQGGRMFHKVHLWDHRASISLSPWETLWNGISNLWGCVLSTRSSRLLLCYITEIDSAVVAIHLVYPY